MSEKLPPKRGKSACFPARSGCLLKPELLSQPQVAAVSPSGGRSVAVLCDHFLEWTQRNRSAATYEWYRYRLQRFVETYPTLNTDELRPHHAERWAGGLSNCQTSHRNYLRSIKRCMKWATRQGFIDKNPIEHLEVPSGEAKEIYVPPDEFAQLCTFIRNQPFLELVKTPPSIRYPKTWRIGKY